MHTPLLIHRRDILETFRTLFECAYDAPGPVMPLGRIIYWEAHMQALREHLGRAPERPGTWMVRLAGGYFFNFSTPVPTLEACERWIAETGDGGGTHCLVPTVVTAPAAEARLRGYRGVPCFVEAWLDRDGQSADTHLRTVLGSRRARDLQRLQRKAQHAFDWCEIDGMALHADAAARQQVATLHASNLAQHGLAVNFYDTPVLERMLDSPLQPYVRVILRHDRATGDPVQMILTFVDRARGDQFVVAQGIDHDRVPADQNLYRSQIVELLTRMEGEGLQRLYMGRGSPIEKRRMGANRFRLLYHWIHGPDADGDLETVCELTYRRLREVLPADLGVLPA